MTTSPVTTPATQEAREASPAPRKKSAQSWLWVLRTRAFLVPVVFVVLVAAWHLASKYLISSQLILPEPGAVAKALWNALTSGPFWGKQSVYFHFWETTKISLIGFVIGAVAGIVLGVMLAQSQLLMRAIGPYITAFQALPRIAIAPIMVIWFGQGFVSNVIITATVVFLPVLVSTISGLETVDRGLLEMLRGFSASRWQTLRKVSFWSALPSIFAGLQVGIVFSVVGAIVAEWVGANAGLGVILLQSQYNMDIPRSFAILILLGVLGLLLNGAIVALQKAVLYWQRDDAQAKSKPALFSS